MADVPISEIHSAQVLRDPRESTSRAFYSLHGLRRTCRRHVRILIGIPGTLLLLCLLYCLVLPNQYEASARVALKLQSASSVSIGAAEMFSPASLLSTPLQLETLVNEIRSEHLEWRVLTELKLYESHAFVRNFAARFPGFDPAKPAPEAQD